MPEPGSCPECGAPPWRGLDCRAQWDELLALEFSDARAGQVHVATVAAYQLQHPAAFRLAAPARQQLRHGLAGVVRHGRSAQQVRVAMGERFAGAARVRLDLDEPTVDEPRPTWSSTVADVLPPDPEAHAERVHAWALAVVADLDAVARDGEGQVRRPPAPGRG